MNDVKQEPRDPDVRPPPANVPPNPQTNAIVNAIIQAVQPVRDGCDYGEAVEMQRDGLPTAMWNGPRDHLLFFRLTQTDDDQVTGQCVQCLEVKERDQGVDAAGIRQQIVQNRGVGRVFFRDGRFVDSNPMRPEGIAHICGW
ncbi:hypothetical protein AAVH_22308 [Aphelenchoides avenae]|nr:hypothetical protein AAVH_22308 [Aphelenchus avenae]